LAEIGRIGRISPGGCCHDVPIVSNWRNRQVVQHLGIISSKLPQRDRPSSVSTRGPSILAKVCYIPLGAFVGTVHSAPERRSRIGALWGRCKGPPAVGGILRI